MIKKSKVNIITLIEYFYSQLPFSIQNLLLQSFFVGGLFFCVSFVSFYFSLKHSNKTRKNLFFAGCLNLFWACSFFYKQGEVLPVIYGILFFLCLTILLLHSYFLFIDNFIKDLNNTKRVYIPFWVWRRSIFFIERCYDTHYEKKKGLRRLYINIALCMYLYFFLNIFVFLSSIKSS